MKRKTFDEFVNRQATRAKEEPFERKKELAQWKDYLNKFYSVVEGFLQKYVDEKKVLLNYKSQSMDEEFIGPYEVKNLTVLIGAAQIQFKPIGTMLIGAKGRVDMTGPRGIVKFLLVDKDSSMPRVSVRVWIKGTEPPQKLPVNKVEWTWKISTPPPKIEYMELREETFFTAMMEVVNG